MQYERPSMKDTHDSHSPQGSMSADGLAQLIVFAKIRAALVFPTPLGPQNRYACANWPLRMEFLRVLTILSWPMSDSKESGLYFLAETIYCDITYKCTYYFANFALEEVEWKMKKILLFLLGITACIAAYSQAQVNVQITTKKDKLADFPMKTMKVVLSGNEFIDQPLRDAVKNTWSISPFEFCSMDDFNSLKTSSDYYFMILVKTQNRKESQPGVTFVQILKGGHKEIGDMLEVASMPLCSSSMSSGLEAAFMPAILDIMQVYIDHSLTNNFKGIQSVMSKLSGIKGKTVVFSADDIAANVGEKFIEKNFNEDVLACEASEAARIMDSNAEDTVVGYSVAPSEPGKGSECFLMLFDSRTHELYYFRKYKISDHVGFTRKDLSDIISARNKK